MSQKLIIFFHRHWGIVILATILIFLGLINLDRNIWLAGWDNFSVSLNLDLNFSRTFSTWRDYRGLGVASDSEMVDVFRQTILFILDIFLPANLVEQLYYLMLLAAGAVGVYCLTREVLKDGYGKIKNKWLLELASLFSAFYYIFNLHTLETFLFPIAMYVARYAFFPWVIYSFILLCQQKVWSKKTLIGFIVSSLLVSTSYLTATIFFTLLIIMAVIVVKFQKSILKYLTVVLLFLALNLFWLLSFGNYYFNKAQLLPATSSFVEVNESLLNKPTSDFSWIKMLTFYPQTLSLEALPYKNIDTGEPYLVHELAHPLAELSFWSQLGILVPLFFVLAGSIVVLTGWTKKKHQPLWILFLAFVTLIFLRKDLPPVGFIYQGLTALIPFFEVVFRFSGPKFYPLLLFSFTLLSGIGVSAVFNKFANLIKSKFFLKQLFLIAIFLLMVLPFKSFFSGNFFSQLVRTEIPTAYFSMANYLNQTENEGRVLHLPYDQFSYWKSYQWGYMGSSFLNFMLSNPLLDRTFEPASPELDQYFMALNTLVNGIVDVSEIEQLRRAELAMSLFSRTNTRYLLLDETISPQLTTKDLNAWGVFHEEDWQALLSILKNQEMIVEVKDEIIKIGKDGIFHLYLYQIKKESLDTKPVLSVDLALDNTFIDPLLKTNKIFIQRENSQNSVTYPFWQPQKDLNYGFNSINLSIPFAHNGQIQWSVDQVELANSNDRIYDIFVSLNQGNLEVFLQQNLVPFADSKLAKFSEKVIFSNYSPVLENKTNKNYLNNWHQLSIDPSQIYRLKIDNNLLPLPQKIAEQPTYLASLLLADQDINLELLAMTGAEKISPESFSLTKNPNCFEDQKENYRYEFDNSQAEVALITQGGMTCITAPLMTKNGDAADFHYEFTTDIGGESTTLKDRENLLEFNDAFENRLEASVLSQPLYLTTQGCLLNSGTGQCLNERDLIVTGKQQRVTLVADQSGDSSGIAVLFILPAKEHEKNSLTLTNSVVNVFVPIEHKRVELSAVIDNSEIIEVAGGEKISLELPYIYSADTLYLDPAVEGFVYYNNLCEQENGLRKIVTTDQIPVLSYLNNCFQGLSSSLDILGNRSYLWDVRYRLLAGRQPRFVVKRNNKSISNEFLSRFYLYPANTKNKIDQSSAEDWLTADNFQSAHKIFSPVDSTNLSSTMEFELQQLVDGQGLVAVDFMNIIALPSYWQNLAVSNGEFELQLDQPEISSTQRIWPSLWKLKLDTSPVTTDQTLLIFDQAYDRQWQIFKTSSWSDALWNRNKLSAEQVKVNGWSNGWLIATDDIAGETEILIFYTPERLTILGWAITTATIMILLSLVFSRSSRRQLRRDSLKKRTKGFLRGFNK